MELYFILHGKEQSGPFTLDMVRSQELTPDTLVRRDDSNTWTPAGNLKALSDLFLSLDGSKTMQSSIKKIRLKEIFSRRATYEPLFPVLIAFFIGSIAIAMGRQTVKGKSQPESRHTHGSAAAATILPHEADSTTAIRVDSVAIQKKEISNHNSIVKPGIVPSQNDALARARYYRDNWPKFMTLTNNSYRHKMLGGIKGLSVVFTNNTGYPVDEVVAAVIYVKANNRTWKTKRVSIRSIPAHGVKRLEIENVNRSRSVKLQIQRLRSASLQLYYEANTK